MNFYKHHIGDYDQATRHLSFVEDAAYSRLIRKYYAEERPLPVSVEKIQKLIGARSKEEKKAVLTVLEEFFELRDDGWHNSRCDEELGTAMAKAERNRTVGKLGGRPRKSGNPDETQTKPTENPDGFVVEPTENPSQTPDSSNQIVERASRLPANWNPSDEEVEFCRKERPDLDPIGVADQFRDYWIGVAGQKGCKRDWSATWRNWVRSQRGNGKAMNGHGSTIFD